MLHHVITKLYVAVAGPVLDLTKQHKLFLKLVAPMVFVSDVAFIFIGKTKIEYECSSS